MNINDVSVCVVGDTACVSIATVAPNRETEPEYAEKAMLTSRDPDNIQLEFFWRASTRRVPHLP
jgi:hypothetical protein